MKPKDSTMMDDGASPERITVSVAYETIGSKRLKMGFVTSGFGDVPDVFGPDQYIHHATVSRMIADEREACAKAVYAAARSSIDVWCEMELKAAAADILARGDKT